MKRRWLIWPALLALALVAAFALAACGGDDDDSADTATGGGGGTSDDVAAVIDELGGTATFGDVQKGGTWRMENTDVALFDGFDPTGEYFGNQWMMMENLLIRPLLSYNWSSTEEGGNDPIADMATEVPEPTDGGLKYTFTIKDGVKFGPPVNREVTSQDFKYAIERIGKPGLGLYANYYAPIKGFPEFQGEGQVGHGHHHARRQDHRLRAQQADRRLPVPPRDAGHRADPRGGGEVPHAGGRVRPLRHLDRPVHARGRRQARHLELRLPEADLGLQPEHRLQDRAQPELRPGHG